MPAGSESFVVGTARIFWPPGENAIRSMLWPVLASGAAAAPLDKRRNSIFPSSRPMASTSPCVQEASATGNMENFSVQRVPPSGEATPPSQVSPSGAMNAVRPDPASAIMVGAAGRLDECLAAIKTDKWSEFRASMGM